jgi:Ser/Thr protein kinase RdoA (MazF antagonist)
MTGPPAAVLAALRVRPGSLRTLKDVPGENSSWLAETGTGRSLVLRRYHAGSTPEDLAYEHTVLRYLAKAGWVVPEPAGDLIQVDGAQYCLTRFVPGQAIGPEPVRQRRRRGRDLARLHVALRELGGQIGQRPGWRAQHAGVSVHTGVDWRDCVAGLRAVSPRQSAWLQAAAEHTAEHTAAEHTGADLAAAGASALPLTVVHGDFAECNVHYARGRLAGVIDFGLTHLDSRPHELAIARTYRAPEAAAAYRAEVDRLGWPLTELEQAAAEPVYHAFRLDLAVWAVHHGLRAGRLDLAAVERQLARTGTPPPA